MVSYSFVINETMAVQAGHRNFRLTTRVEWKGSAHKEKACTCTLAAHAQSGNSEPWTNQLTCSPSGWTRLVGFTDKNQSYSI